ncbi:MAG: hypothetical protein HOE80_02855 [Candidatus Magasanikbacteria bacterium]|jgi:hypothetical protein|nr:hypothetical protein [Candidatus Magasanikbacteria bacterium]MBT4071638.1 hypothetical protein [Candidatus Magasanikbacteria bacterium]
MSIEIRQSQEVELAGIAGESELTDVERIIILRRELAEADKLMDAFRIEFLGENDTARERELLEKLESLDLCNAKKMNFDTGILGKFPQGDKKSAVAEKSNIMIGTLYLLLDARFTRNREECINIFLSGWIEYKKALEVLISSCEDNT